MISANHSRWLRMLLAPEAWMLAGLLIVPFVMLASLQSSSPVAEAHGTVDQQQLVIGGVRICGSGGCGQTFTPTATNIVAFDVNIDPQSTLNDTAFTLRLWPAGPILAGPFPVTLTADVNHIDIPGGPIALVPGNKYEIHATGGNPFFRRSAADLYAGGAETGPTRVEEPVFDLVFATYFLPVTATPTVTATTTRTVTPTATASATPILVATVRPNVAGAFAGGASGTERNLQRAGITNDPRAPLQPVPPQQQAGGIAATQGRSPPGAGVLRPPSTGDAGLAGD